MVGPALIGSANVQVSKVQVAEGLSAGGGRRVGNPTTLRLSTHDVECRAAMEASSARLDALTLAKMWLR